MQPARKLLSLLFLILMGTELTQVRASNAIFLPACEAPARPGAGQSRGAAPHSPAPPGPGARPRGWGGDQLHLGCRKGCRLTPDCCSVPQDRQPRALPPGRPGCPLPTEKFKGRRRGPFGAHCHPGGRLSRRSEPPARSEVDVTQLPPLHPCPWLQLLPLGLRAGGGHGAGETRPGRAGRVSEAGVPCGFHVEVWGGGCGHMRGMKRVASVCGDRWAF